MACRGKEAGASTVVKWPFPEQPVTKLPSKWHFLYSGVTAYKRWSKDRDVSIHPPPDFPIKSYFYADFVHMITIFYVLRTKKFAHGSCIFRFGCGLVLSYPYPWELLHWLENNCTIETVWYEQIAHMHGLLRGDYINTKQITKSRVHISSDTLDGLAQGCGDADVLELPQSYDRPSTWTVDIFQPR